MHSQIITGEGVADVITVDVIAVAIIVAVITIVVVIMCSKNKTA